MHQLPAAPAATARHAARGAPTAHERAVALREWHSGRFRHSRGIADASGGHVTAAGSALHRRWAARLAGQGRRRRHGRGSVAVAAPQVAFGRHAWVGNTDQRGVGGSW